MDMSIISDWFLVNVSTANSPLFHCAYMKRGQGTLKKPIYLSIVSWKFAWKLT